MAALWGPNRRNRAHATLPTETEILTKLQAPGPKGGVLAKEKEWDTLSQQCSGTTAEPCPRRPLEHAPERTTTTLDLDSRKAFTPDPSALPSRDGGSDHGPADGQGEHPLDSVPADAQE